MRTTLLFLTSFALSGCISIPEYNNQKFDEKAVVIEKVYNKPYDKLHSCLMRMTSGGNVTSYATKTEAFYSLPGFLKITFTPLTQDTAKVRASSIGYFAKAEDYMTLISLCASTKN